MNLEIERKFLVDLHKWQQVVKPAGDFFRQGYIVNDPVRTVRIRLTGNSAFITIKGITEGFSRPEFEYEIPQQDAQHLLDVFCTNELSKTRYRLTVEGKLWEVDVFHGENEGLIVAEIELESEEESFTLPDWVKEEVTEDTRYYNSNLSSYPYKSW